MQPTLPQAVAEEEALGGSVAANDRGADHIGNMVVLTDQQPLGSE